MKHNDGKIELKKITKSDYPFLYELLAERDPSANISHRKMPTYQKHVEFVMSKPYSKWYVIYCNKEKAGSIYLSKQNEIGIFVKKGKQGKGMGTQVLKLLIKKNPRWRYLANINPKNTRSIKFFKKHGFKLIQHTYEFIDQNNR